MNSRGKIEKNSGITLISLIVTIIILLILAGVTLNLSLGEDGIIKRASDAKNITEDAQVKEVIGLAYSQAYIKSFQKEIDIAEEIQSDLEKTFGSGNVEVTANDNGYEIEIASKGTFQIDSNGNAEKTDTKLKLGYEITQTDGTALAESTRYSKALVKIFIKNISQVDVNDIKLLDYQNNEITAQSLDKDAKTATFEVSKNMTYTAEVEGKIAGKNATSKLNVKVNCLTLATFDRYKTEGKIDIVWIDQSNNIIEAPLAPNLQGNMKKLIFDDESKNFVETTSNDWYEYKSVTSGTNTTSRWANAKTTDGSMWVWIPRYAYKITYYDTDGTTEIGYSCARGIVTVDGDVVAENNEGIETVEDYIVHPAFTSSAENGGGFGEISGFWFAKFETSGSFNAETGFKSVDGVWSLRSTNIGDFYKYARQQLYGETGNKDVLDNYTSFGNSHMIKNSEWGAVLYLSHSSYGTNGKMIEQYRSNYITGGKTTEVYANNVTLSTTQNPYGIYDLSGCSLEFVAGYINNGSIKLSTDGGEMTKELDKCTKFKTVYKSITQTAESSAQSLDYELNNKMKGDAVYETSNSYSNVNGSWQSTRTVFPCGNYPFFGRGSACHYSFGSAFRFEGVGNYDGSCSSRLALVFE